MNKKLTKLALIVAITAMAVMAPSATASDIAVFTTAGYEAAIHDLSAGTTVLVNDGNHIGDVGNQCALFRLAFA